MSGWFFDSSALAKRYHPETGTEKVDQIVGTTGNRIFVSELVLIEMPSAFAIKVRTGLIGREDAQRALAQFGDDIAVGSFVIASIREAEFTLARALIERHAFDRRLRSLDAVQLAAALILWHHGRIEYFVASDRVLCDVAASEGLSVVNPEAF